MRSFVRSGQVLKKYRQSFGMTQRDACKEFNMHSQFWSNAERGMCLLPTPVMKALLKRHLFPKSDFINALKEDLIESHMQKYQDKPRQKLKTATQERNARHKARKATWKI